LPEKTNPKMTDAVSSGMLNPTHSLTYCVVSILTS